MQPKQAVQRFISFSHDLYTRCSAKLNPLGSQCALNRAGMKRIRLADQMSAHDAKSDGGGVVAVKAAIK